MCYLPVITVGLLSVLTAALLASAQRGPATVTAGPIITEYLIPTGGSQSVGIAPGPDGAVWFTEFRRVTRSGASPPAVPSMLGLLTAAGMRHQMTPLRWLCCHTELLHRPVGTLAFHKYDWVL